MITLEETTMFFPTRAEYLTGYELIPYSRELLYTCSEQDYPFVLVPGLHHFGKDRPLTIRGMKKYCDYLPNLFGPPELFEKYSNTPCLDNKICLPRWYLLAKNSLDDDTVSRFFINAELGVSPEIWKVEPAVVYVFAWLLFHLIRQETIFQGEHVACDDIYPTAKTKVQLLFSKGHIRIGQWSPKISTNIPNAVPSIKSYAE